ncbi:MAG: phosphoglycerate kinase, partial [Chlamydiae bacterium]|nr:phosphoglycerate kinase [Chlamydiota bacterium]
MFLMSDIKSFKSLFDLQCTKKKVLVRVDYNVPLSSESTITDLTRIKASLPTLEFLLQQQASIILLSHLGRPKGRKEKKYTLQPCVEALSTLLDRPVLFSDDCLGASTCELVHSLQPGELLLLENLRFYPAEEDPSQDPSFAKQLATYGDFYVNDAFGSCHRNHASIVPLAKLFPGKAAAGFLVEKEIKALSHLLENPTPPFFVLMGGAKVSSKIGPLRSLLPKVEALFIGGAMAYTFLQAQGFSIGDSLYEPEYIPVAQEILALCQKRGIALHLPSDFLLSNPEQSPLIASLPAGIPKGSKGMDVGPETLLAWKTALSQAGSIFWNGPLGVFECPTFAQGTLAIAKHLASLS